eukprot:602573-Rhodomonas_salina.1
MSPTSFRSLPPSLIIFGIILAPLRIDTTFGDLKRSAVDDSPRIPLTPLRRNIPPGWRKPLTTESESSTRAGARERSSGMMRGGSRVVRVETFGEMCPTPCT